MAKYRKPRRVSAISQSRSGTDDFEILPLPALGALAFGFFFFFLASEIGFYGRGHPLHWLTAAGGAALGYLIGLFYSRASASR